MLLEGIAVMPVCILLGDYRDIAHEREGLVNVLGTLTHLQE